jgi:tousled-like kinase
LHGSSSTHDSSCSHIKIADFGLSKLLEENHDDNIELTSPGYGSYWYLPPECFVSQEGKEAPLRISSKVDVWSTGIIFYQMLYGRRPVGNDLRPGKMLIDTIVNSSSIDFPTEPAVSPEAKDFISRCLSPEVGKRPDIASIFEDPYLQATPSALKKSAKLTAKKAPKK